MNSPFLFLAIPVVSEQFVNGNYLQVPNFSLLLFDLLADGILGRLRGFRLLGILLLTLVGRFLC